MSEAPISIYEVLRKLVDKAQFPHETEIKRMKQAIDNAEKNQLFGTEGMMKL